MKVLLFANTEWYLYNFRRSLAQALRAAGHEVFLVSPPGPYGNKLRELGFSWVPAPMARRSLNPVSEVALILWLRSLIKRERIDLVHGFTIKCAVYGSLAARAAGVGARINAVAGMGYVFTSSDLRATLLRPIVRMLLGAALGGRGARLILQNPDDVAMFETWHLLSPAHIRLVRGSGVDCSRFTPVDPKLRTASRLRIVLPARLLWDKGVAEYAEAARMVQAEGLPVEFLLAGEPDPGNPASVPESVVRGWVADGTLQWLGHVSDMPRLFQSTDIAVLPSYREGLPKGLIEAAACGIPLVTTDVPGCREVVRDGLEGLLVPPRNARALAEAISKLCRDAGLRRRLGDAARHRARSEFDEEIVISRTLAVYAEVLPRATKE